MFQQRRLDLDRSDLGPVRAQIHARLSNSTSGVNVFHFTPGSDPALNSSWPLLPSSPAASAPSGNVPRQRARFKATATRRVDRHPFGQRDRRVTERGLRQTVGVVRGALRNVHVHRQPRRAAGVLPSGATPISGGNMSFEQPVNDTGAGGVVRERLTLTHLPGSAQDSAARRAQGAVAARRQRQESFAAARFRFRIPLSPDVVPWSVQELLVYFPLPGCTRTHGVNTPRSSGCLMTGAAGGAPVTVACTG